MSSEKISTKDRILRATWSQLESGGHETRMSDIAKAAGISRQALYLHYPNRAELLIATTRYVDQVKNVDERLAVSRASTGTERLDAFIDAWGNYIPEVYGVSRALRAMKDRDDEAKSAWNDRMDAVRHGCAAAIKAIMETERLSHDLSPDQATDLLWTLLSIANWEQLTLVCGWPQETYIRHMQETARRALLTDPTSPIEKP